MELAGCGLYRYLCLSRGSKCTGWFLTTKNTIMLLDFFSKGFMTDAFQIQCFLTLVRTKHSKNSCLMTIIFFYTLKTGSFSHSSPRSVTFHIIKILWNIPASCEKLVFFIRKEKSCHGALQKWPKSSSRLLSWARQDSSKMI